LFTFWTFQTLSFTFEKWATCFFIGAGTDEFRAFWASWSWSWFADGRLTSTFISSFNNHLAWSARSDLNSWAESIDANHLSWATAFSAFDEADSFLNLAFVTFGFFNLWTVERFFVATFTRKTLLGWTTVIVQTVFISSCTQKFTFLTFKRFWARFSFVFDVTLVSVGLARPGQTTIFSMSPRFAVDSSLFHLFVKTEAALSGGRSENSCLSCLSGGWNGGRFGDL
jgi:hypothetical protein